jgi:hypothetical protein
LDKITQYSEEKGHICKYEKSYKACFKGTVSRDFRPLVFSSNNPTWAPDSQLKAFLHMASNSRRYSTFKSPILAPAVSKRSLDNPYIFV